MHRFKCAACKFEFCPDMRKYKADPSIRKCIKCKKGPVMYEGQQGDFQRHISDDLPSDGLLSQADGKKYNSKSSYYKSLKENGYEIVGNEKLGPSQPKLNEINWEKAVSEAINGG